MAVSGAVWAHALVRFVLVSADANRLAAFYEQALGCRRQPSERRSGPDFERLMGAPGGALRVTLTLGDQIIELLQFDHPGRPYPSGESAADLDFQHFAVVVGDMRRAYKHLLSTVGWSPISRDGPVQLPPSSGAVTAFKFRDPEGHPLELLAFPNSRSQERGLGIDHSAIAVCDTASSVAFYAGLGFKVAAHSHNVGSEQQSLDNVGGAEVEVTALQLLETTPHLELLCYRHAHYSDATRARCDATDVAATRLVFATRSGGASEALLDPDGHRLILVPTD